MHEHFRPNFYEQRRKDRTPTHQRLPCGERGKFLNIYLREVVRCAADKGLIIRILDAHRDDRIRLTRHIAVEFTGPLTNYSRSNTKFAPFRENLLDDWEQILDSRAGAKV